MQTRRDDGLRIASCVVAAMLTALSSTDAKAHLAPPIVRADRILTIVLFERPTLSYAVRISPVELARIREAHDLDHDGAISRAEADAILDGWTRDLQAMVRYAHTRIPSGSSVGAPLSKAILLGREATGLEGPVLIPSPATAAFARVAWSFDLRFAKDDSTLTLVDEAGFLPFDHSEVVVRDTATRPLVGLGLVTAVAPDAPLSATPHLAWVDAGVRASRTIVITWRTPPDWTTPIALGLGCVAAATFVVVSALRARAHRRRG